MHFAATLNPQQPGVYFRSRKGALLESACTYRIDFIDFSPFVKGKTGHSGEINRVQPAGGFGYKAIGME
jgi:hypothetical protein